MSNNKYFCYEIYKNLAIWSNNGQLVYGPCSFFKGWIKTNNKFDLSEVWNSPEHLELKHKIENNSPIEGCQYCYNEEANGLISRRLASIKLYEEYHHDVDIELDGPQGLDYSVGNLCNLKCVICGPNSSSSWIPDYQKLNPTVSIKSSQYQKFNQIEITNPELLKNITNLHFHGGGEPLLSSNHVNLLKKIDMVKGLSDIRVFYNTNGTQRVDQEILNLWGKCKLVEIYFSIDDIEDRFNYQRTGANWKEIIENLQWFRDNMPHNHMFNVNCVWSYLNFFYLPELVDWFQNSFSTNRYGDPTNLIFQRARETYNLKHLSGHVKKILQERFMRHEELLNLLASVDTDNLPHTDFWSNINALDAVRNKSFKKVCPEWSALL